MLFVPTWILLLLVPFSTGLPRPETAGTSQNPKETRPRQLLYVSERQQQYAPALQYDLPLLHPQQQFQVPTYNFIEDKQPFHRYVIFYKNYLLTQRTVCNHYIIVIITEISSINYTPAKRTLVKQVFTVLILMLHLSTRSLITEP